MGCPIIELSLGVLVNHQYEFGTPGASLSGESFYDKRKRADVGASGERRTADLLRGIQQHRHLPNRFAVIHDVMLPSDRYTANIDHIVIAGKSVLIIDSKVWSSGLYATFKGKTYVLHSKKTRTQYNKMVARFEAGDHKTLPMTLNILNEWTKQHGLNQVNFMNPLMIVWPPEGKNNPSVRFYTPPGVTAAVTPEVARVRLAKSIPTQPPNQQLLDLFLSLMSG
jgi:hypothetical protein